MARLPIRGAAVRELGLALPPEPLPAWLGGRPRKRWRYVGVYTPELLLCVGDARVGPVPQRWWAVALPDGGLSERTTFGRGGVAVDAPWSRSADAAGPSRVRVEARGVSIDLTLDEIDPVEVVTPTNDRGAYYWTAKQACVPVRGTVELDGVRRAVDGDAGFIDDSAGYHPRHTVWKWSAGVGRASDGRRVGWNLIDGIHDDPRASERTVWVDGRPQEVGPVGFAEDMSVVTGEAGEQLRFDQWSAREHATNALIMRSRYRQPFGSFSGTLPGGIELAEGYGVMEDHDVHW
jgi:hypothetical protein